MNNKPLLQAFKNQTPERVPFWLMRQAGRYLPEYRELRQKAGGFLDLAFNPEQAAEVTIQPLRRFNMDGAILFSDILVIPMALGQDLKFETGDGPKLPALDSAEDLKRLSGGDLDATLAPVYETIKLIRSGMEQEGFNETTLIGFAGAPWTVATYMVEGGSSRDFMKTKRWAYSDPDGFAQLIDMITDATIHYLGKQIEAGVEAVKIFDSWAGVLDEQQFRRWVIAPATKIVSALHEKYPEIPVIGFPKGAGPLYQDYLSQTGVDVLALDQTLPLAWAAKNLQTIKPVQGNLDPLLLLNGGQAMEDAVKRILENFADGGFIFNLGHGIHKETPPENVAQLAEIIKNWRK